jgi:hypothetical protein
MPTTARTASELSKINQLIHDYWFDIEDVSFDAQAGVVTLPFTRPEQDKDREVGKARLLQKVEVPYYLFLLRIYHVKQWHVEDRERVGLYDFNEVIYELPSGLVRITTGIPIHLVAEVEELELSVEKTDKVVSTKVRRKLL